MIYKKFYINVILRVFIIVITSLLLSYVLIKTAYVYTVAGLIILIVLQTVNLIRYLNKTNRYLSNFLYFLKENNATMSVTESSNDSPISDLHTYFNEIKNIIKNVRIEKENQYLYLQYIIENVGIGLMSFNDNGKIELINDPAKNLLGIPVLHNIHDLNKLQEGFSSFIINLKPQQPELYKLNLGGELVHLSVKASKIKIGERSIVIVSFQDIKNEMDDNELDSYQKLIRVLTHEIMNSITPINTLTRTLKKLYTKPNGQRRKVEIDDDIIDETITGLELIEERGTGLTAFVNKYRSLTKLPQPFFRKVKVFDMLANMIRLFEEEAQQHQVVLEMKVEPGELTIHADEKLLAQVLINLVKNAIASISEGKTGHITLSAKKASSFKTIIQVSDNGMGISKENINNIFTPFFTTKENGSGIGLSIAKQIMRMHKGHITVKSEPGKGTTFTLEF